MEGVLMRGRDAIAVALRHPDGRIVTATERLDSGVHGNPAAEMAVHPRARRPVRDARHRARAGSSAAPTSRRRGGRRRARQGLGRADAAADPRRRRRASSSCCPCSSRASRPRTSRTASSSTSSRASCGSRSSWATSCVIGRAPDIRRVFQYHGAEHMTIHALEAGDPLTVDEVRKYPTAHQRCGTEFLVIVIILSILAFSLVGRQTPLVMIVSRHPAHPGHRRASATRSSSSGRATAATRSSRSLMYPGILVQMITTKQPDRRHDRGRHRLDGGGARGRRQHGPGRARPTLERSPMLGRRAARATPRRRRTPAAAGSGHRPRADARDPVSRPR